MPNKTQCDPTKTLSQIIEEVVTSDGPIPFTNDNNLNIQYTCILLAGIIKRESGFNAWALNINRPKSIARGGIIPASGELEIFYNWFNSYSCINVDQGLCQINRCHGLDINYCLDERKNISKALELLKINYKGDIMRMILKYAGNPNSEIAQKSAVMLVNILESFKKKFPKS